VNGLKLFGHPVHAMLVHAPMGLLGIAPLWDVIGAVRGDALFFAIGFWTVSAGVAAALLAACAGFVDFAGLEERSPAEKPALRHMTIMLAAVSVFGASLIFRHGSTAPEGAQLIATLACDAVGLLALGFGGHEGGELVYKHGVGRVR
jgi:uncharacterized membrane protein